MVFYFQGYEFDALGTEEGKEVEYHPANDVIFIYYYTLSPCYLTILYRRQLRVAS